MKEAVEVKIPNWLDLLILQISRGVSSKNQKKYADELIQAIPSNDLDLIKWKFCFYILKINIETVEHLKTIDDKLRRKILSYIQMILFFHIKAITMGIWDFKRARSYEYSTQFFYHNWPIKTKLGLPQKEYYAYMAYVSSRASEWAPSVAAKYSVESRANDSDRTFISKLFIKKDHRNAYQILRKILLRLLKESQ